MKFRAERTQFADAISWARRTVADRASLPAAAGIRLAVEGDRLQLVSTNLEMDSALSLPVQAERPGAALVLGRLLDDVVRSLPGAPVDAEVEGDVLHLRCGRAKFDLRLMPVEDFPPRPEPSPDGLSVVMKAGEFATTVAQVARAASPDDARPQLTGVNLEAQGGLLTAAATDSYRLAVRTIPWDQQANISVLVPRRAMEEARRSAEVLGGEVRLALEAAQVSFEFGDRRLATRLIEATFPDFRQLIPSGWERRLQIDRAQLIEVVKRVAVVGDTNTATTPVTLELTSDTVRVSAGTGEVGQAEESLPGRLEGEPLQIAFNPRYLADGLDACDAEQVVLEFRDELKPAVIRPTSPANTAPEPGGGEDQQPSQPAEQEQTADFLYLLMPVRL